MGVAYSVPLCGPSHVINPAWLGSFDVMKLQIALWLGVLATAGSFRTNAQQTNRAAASDPMPVVIKKPGEVKLKSQSFTFVRIKYSIASTGRVRANMWATDYPDADRNFASQFEKVTGLKCDTNGVVLELTDPELKQHPFIYIAEGGHLHLSDDEVRSLREYLLGGGFLMVDDFWGEAEWQSLVEEFSRAFPDRKPMDLPIDHELFRSFYQIREKPQVPSITTGIQSQRTGVTWERTDGKEAHYRGLVDDKGRLMAVFCHNTDLGDGWERADADPYYLREFSLKKAYPMGINIVVYALSH